MSHPQISVVIPCYNEEKTVNQTIETLKNQTLKPTHIFFVDDCSTDQTHNTLLKLKKENSDLKVTVLKTPKNLFRAGACNTGLQLVKTKYVIMMDAGTILDHYAVENAIKLLEQDLSIGLVCSRAGIQKGKGLLHTLQKLEYANTDLSRMMAQNNIQISHGLFSASRTKILRQVGFYSEKVLLEDYDLTVKVKLAGYKAVFSPTIKAYTNTIKTLKALYKQRFRWFIGGLDVISKFKWNEATKQDILGHTFYFMFFSVIISSILLGGSHFMRFPSFNYFMLVPLLTVVINFMASCFALAFVENLTKKEILIRLLVFPELFYTLFLESIRWRAYFAKLFVSARRW